MKKNISNYILGALSLLILGSCSKKIDEVHINPNALPVQPIESLLPNIIASMCISGGAVGANFGPQADGQYVGRYVQFWATNTAADQYDKMGQTTTNSIAAAADIGGGIFAMHYFSMGANLSRIIEWGTEQKKWDYVGVAQAIRAWAWLSVTDMHGEVIVKQAFDDQRRVFAYDSQKVAHDEAKKYALLAIENLSKTGDGVSAVNLALGAQWCSYKGDVNKWKKFAYSILARVYHRTTNKADYKADSAIYYANLGINENADNLYIFFSNDRNNARSFYGPTRGNIGTFRQTKFIADLESGVVGSGFAGVQDPRAWYIIRENTPAGTFKGIRPGKGSPDLNTAADAPPNFWGGASTSTAGSDVNARYIFKDAMPWPVVTASEMHFLKAEAYYRKNLKSEALTEYTAGIDRSFDMLMNEYTSPAIPGTRILTPAIKATYLANPVIVPTAANLRLSHIMLQKYIALYGYGFMETWADLRRFHYTDQEGAFGQVYIMFAPPDPADLYINNNFKYIYRVRPRFNSEFLYNFDELSRIGATALDYHTKEQWFSLP
ncbi:MAG TPA: SusD/RagB family nutrient-binding outer membrane lipoprotein [Ferruginibacter sp.]|nr:SusD/RagB family nutrient-binding outer membrane lipoprotein [Ferruginibacter sp.]